MNSNLHMGVVLLVAVLLISPALWFVWRVLIALMF